MLGGSSTRCVPRLLLAVSAAVPGRKGRKKGMVHKFDTLVAASDHRSSILHALGKQCTLWCLHCCPIYVCIINAPRGYTPRFSVMEGAEEEGRGQHHFLMMASPPKRISEQAMKCWPLVLLPAPPPPGWGPWGPGNVDRLPLAFP